MTIGDNKPAGETNHRDRREPITTQHGAAVELHYVTGMRYGKRVNYTPEWHNMYGRAGQVFIKAVVLRQKSSSQ